jgi:hypothetical protein
METLLVQRDIAEAHLKEIVAPLWSMELSCAAVRALWNCCPHQGGFGRGLVDGISGLHFLGTAAS